MKRISVIFVIILFLGPENIFAFDNSITHKNLTLKAVEKFGLEKYVNNNFIPPNNFEYKDALTCIQNGSYFEDEPNCRASNHFHNPIISDWLDAGIKDIPDAFRAYCAGGDYPVADATSCLHWATRYYSPEHKTSGAGNTHDWDIARESYYTAVTGRDYAGKQIWAFNSSEERKKAMETFFSNLGYVLHLLQDMAVPAHVRSDFMSHMQWVGINWNNCSEITKWVKEQYEDYVKKQDASLIKPIKPANIQTTKLSDPVVWKFWDSDVYTGSGTNPGSLDFADLGLSEYTSLNFASRNTVLTEGLGASDNYYQPYPAMENTNISDYILELPQTVLDKSQIPADIQYVSKKGEGTAGGYGPTVGKFMIPGYLSEYVEKGIEESSPPEGKIIYHKTFMIDDACAENYATILIPKAISYSAALLDYFFRGKMGLAIDQDVCRIANQTEELMEGTFELYYDTVGGERRPVTGVEKWPWSHTGWISAGDQSADLDLFAVPGDAQSPGDYMLVFKGRMGQETSNAVAASKVTIPAIRISLPEEGYYALNGDTQCVNEPGTCGFNKIVINAENISPQAGGLGQGTVTLMIKYRQGLSDQFVTPPGATGNAFSTIYAGLPDAVSIPSGTSTRLEFELGAGKIPLWATDVHLFLLFTEDVDGQPGRVCLGYKDISEPTPFDFFNVMDKACLNNKIYDAGSPGAIEIVDTNHDGVADERDVYPHAVTDLSIRFSDNTAYWHTIPRINPGGFSRVFALIDYDRFDMHLGYYKLPLQDGDPFNHSQYVTETFSFCGVMNQFIREAFDGCPAPSCRIRYYMPFIMFRDISSWAEAIIANLRYPSTSVCDYGQ